MTCVGAKNIHANPPTLARRLGATRPKGTRMGRSRGVLTVLAGCAALVAGVLVAPAPQAAVPAVVPTASPAAQPAGGSLEWERCGPKKWVRECATLEVPLDYARPGKGTITLHLARIPARGDRGGAILLNPGGPGISGVDEILKYPDYLSTDAEEHYDVVGFDPRGVGRSAPLWCRDTEQMQRYSSTLAGAGWATSPKDPSVGPWREQARLFGEGCEANDPRLVRHVGTIASAHDMDRIRVALGQDTLDYVGWSYGTKLGSVYANLYPQRVGRMVLDSAINPALNIVQFNQGQSYAMEQALWRFFDYCRTRLDCAIPRGKGPGTDFVLEFLWGLPVERTTPDTLTRADGLSAFQTSMYNPDYYYPVLYKALRAALAGNGKPMIELGGGYGDQDPDKPSNFLNALYGINCYDSPRTPSLKETARLARQWGRSAPVFGPPAAWGLLRCRHFPAHTPQPTGPVTAKGAPPIVIVGALRDAATPVGWSYQLAGQIRSSRLVIADTGIHSVYPAVSPCVRRIVDAYLLEGGVPSSPTFCPPPS